MQENYLVQLQSITFLGKREEYWNLEFTDVLFAIYPKLDTEIYLTYVPYNHHNSQYVI